MLTQRENLNVLDYDQLIVIFMEHCPVDQVAHVLLVPLGEKEHGSRVPLRRTAQPLALRVLTEALENGAYCIPTLGKSRVRLLRCSLKSITSAKTYVSKKREEEGQSQAKTHNRIAEKA